MTPRHHPSEATLLAYGAGSLGEGLSLLVAGHLSFCPECRVNLAAAESLGGGLLEELAPVPLEAGARDRTLALIAREPAPAIVAPPPRVYRDPLIPAPLERYLGTGLDGIRWRMVVPGLAQSEIVPHDLLGSGSLRMLRIAKGKSLPRHGHTGTELTLVLKGDFSDHTGEFVRGDLAETDEDLVHEPVSGRKEDCICVIATEGPLKFESALARLFQKFTGF